MGRVVRKINTDGIDQITLNDILIKYEGCVCTGGLVAIVDGKLMTPGCLSAKTPLFP